MGLKTKTKVLIVFTQVNLFRWVFYDSILNIGQYSILQETLSRSELFLLRDIVPVNCETEFTKYINLTKPLAM